MELACFRFEGLGGVGLSDCGGVGGGEGTLEKSIRADDPSNQMHVQPCCTHANFRIPLAINPRMLPVSRWLISGAFQKLSHLGNIEHNAIYI